MSKLPALQELLNYKNPLVIKRFQRNFPAFKEDAEHLFVDLLKYLWLCKKHYDDKVAASKNPNLDFTTIMPREMTMIDEMWHTFILITKDYAEFCQEYFGGFLHHVPDLVTETEEISTYARRKFKRELQLFLSYVYEHLGEETVRRWFSVYLVDQTG